MQHVTSPDELLGRTLAVGDVVIVVRCENGGNVSAAGLTSILLHAQASCPIVLLSPHPVPPHTVELIRGAEKTSHRTLFLVANPPGSSGAATESNVADFFDYLAPADLIVVSAESIVGTEWDVRMIAAGRSSTTTATATALTSGSSIFGVGTTLGDSDAIADPSQASAIAERIAQRAAKLRPYGPVAGAHCVYMSRRALNVVSATAADLSVADGLWLDLSFRCAGVGLVNVLADDVFVSHPQGTDATARWNTVAYAESDALIRGFLAAGDLPYHRALNIARVAANGLRIVVDAERLSGGLNGTFEAAVSLCRALDEHADVNSIVWTASEQQSAGVQSTLAALQAQRPLHKTTFVSHRSIRLAGQFDVAFRPYQDFAAVEWPFIAELGARNVIWSLDLILNQVPQYSRGYENYRDHIGATEASFDRADGIAVLSAHVMRDALAFSHGAQANLLFVLPAGAPSSATQAPQEHAGLISSVSKHSTAVTEILGEKYIFVLGTDYPHKNIGWARRIFERVSQLGWTGHLVFAGPTINPGNDADDANDALTAQFRNRIHALGRVTDEEREALFSHAQVVLFPTLTEGWGMIPFEASAAGCAPLATRAGGLDEITPQGALTLTLADDAADAQTLFELLTTEKLRKKQLSLWQQESARHSWENSADILVAQFFALLGRPSRINPRDRDRYRAEDSLIPRAKLIDRVRHRFAN